MSNENRARALWEAVGFACEPEPDWIEEGQRPDFFCSGHSEFWCEVKTLELTSEFSSLSDLLKALSNRAKDIQQPGRGMAFAGAEVSDLHLKKITLLLSRSLGRFADNDAPNEIVALIPEDPNFSQFVRFTISTKDHQRVEIHSFVSSTDTYALPFSVEPHTDDQSVEMQFSTGEVKLRPGYEFMDGTFRLAVVAWPENSPFSFVSVAPSGATKEMTTLARLRETVGEANSQFKNAVKYKDAPCLLVIFHDGVDVADDMILKSALYGDLKYQFTPGKRGDGKLFVEGNGTWNPTKNRTTSAVMYICNGAKPVIVRNWWAYRPLPQLNLSAKVVNLREDGNFEEIDCSSVQGQITS